MTAQAFRTPITDGALRIVSGSTGRQIPIISIETEGTSNMTRLEGTGTDPLGRYGKGEIFDVPKQITSGEGDDLVTTANASYQELLDKGWAVEVAPEDDPGRTVTQIADTMVSSGGDALLPNPHDAAVAARIEGDEYAIQHTGDPGATAEGDLKTEAINEAQSTDKRQWGADVAPSENIPAEEAAPEDQSGASEGSSPSPVSPTPRPSSSSPSGPPSGGSTSSGPSSS